MRNKSSLCVLFAMVMVMACTETQEVEVAYKAATDLAIDHLFICVPGSTTWCATDLPGVCYDGLMTCPDDGSGWDGICVPLINPGNLSEICGDGLDNDCDGRVDNGCTFVCVPDSTASCDTTLAGPCAKGQTTCLDDGTGYGPCVVVVPPVSEVCDDGLDNDCDGRVDALDRDCSNYLKYGR